MNELAFQLNSLASGFNMGRDVIHIDEMTFRPPTTTTDPTDDGADDGEDDNAEPTESLPAALIINAAWSDGCGRDAAAYDQKLVAWKSMLEYWKQTPPTILIDNEPVDSGDIVELSAGFDATCDYFDNSISGRCFSSNGAAGVFGQQTILSIATTIFIVLISI